MISLAAGAVFALTRVPSILSTIALAHLVRLRNKTVYQLRDFDPEMAILIFAAIFGNIAQACANRGNPITAAAAEATFSATSGGSLFASDWGSDYNDCEIGRGEKGRGASCNGNGRVGRCSWTTFTGNWGPSWLVSWSGFGGDDNCSTTTGSSLTAATSPSRVSATTTASPSLSLGATVITTINGQTLTGTIFSAPANMISGTTGTAASAQQTGKAGRQQPFGAFSALVLSLVAAVSMF